MNEKRTLVSALTMTPEKRAFIEGGPRPMSQLGSERAVPPEPEAQDSDQQDNIDESQPVVGDPRRRRRRQGRVRREEEPLASMSRFRNLRMPLTTSLRPEMLDALRRLSLERRLSGVVPSAIQEIVEEALEQWLSAQ
jgi:hypothetical protein